MTVIEAAISGFIQGVTEFLPVSSSGHLVLAHYFFGYDDPGLFYDICLHCATLAAVLVFFARDIKDIIVERRYSMIAYIVIGTIPAVVMALLAGDVIEKMFFSGPAGVALMLFVTGAALFAAHYSFRRGAPAAKIRWGKALLIGIAQAIAIIPGISRSGFTITAGAMTGLSRPDAFRFSFLLSIPAILGALVLSFIKGGARLPSTMAPVSFIAGMVVAFVAGLLSLNVLKKVIKAGRLPYFGAYCILLGAVVLIVSIATGS
ncbi:MAG: undecaprenyl-diphosphate phosphatase [Candidatus Omnitrophica bacterium]|nr:undecaprenyl-diphosphate phosphatase [Candidatus Omnitrophota bacterium]MDD5487914.1 undecaprenyl-diphosphate phosphatase [Candidatus Omnitrophota bacterium]